LPGGSFALIQACKNGHLEVAQYMVRAGASLTTKDNNGWTMAHAAACSGHARVVRWCATLGDSGLDLWEKDSMGYTVLKWAQSGTEAGHRELEEFMKSQPMPEWAKKELQENEMAAWKAKEAEDAAKAKAARDLAAREAAAQVDTSKFKWAIEVLNAEDDPPTWYQGHASAYNAETNELDIVLPSVDMEGEVDLDFADVRLIACGDNHSKALFNQLVARQKEYAEKQETLQGILGAKEGAAGGGGAGAAAAE
jgi:hypothetical protein